MSNYKINIFGVIYNFKEYKYFQLSQALKVINIF